MNEDMIGHIRIVPRRAWLGYVSRQHTPERYLDAIVKYIEDNDTYYIDLSRLTDTSYFTRKR